MRVALEVVILLVSHDSIGIENIQILMKTTKSPYERVCELMLLDEKQVEKYRGKI